MYRWCTDRNRKEYLLNGLMTSQLRHTAMPTAPLRRVTLSVIIIIIIIMALRWTPLDDMLCRAGNTLAGYSIMLRSTTWSIVLWLEPKYHHPRSHKVSEEMTEKARWSDFLTLVWHSGHSATWDVTVVHTLAASYVTQSAVQAGKAAKIAAERKSAKYSGLSSIHIFYSGGCRVSWSIGGRRRYWQKNYFQYRGSARHGVPVPTHLKMFCCKTHHGIL